MITTAVIMAAGLGTRFGRQTELKPKGFITYKGKPMVIRAIETMFEAGIEKIIIGTGYHKEWYEALENEYPGKVKCVFSPNEFTKCVDKVIDSKHPNAVSIKEFREWKLQNQLIDHNMQFESKAVIVVKPGAEN